jgi:HEPN domain-containing protein
MALSSKITHLLTLLYCSRKLMARKYNTSDYNSEDLLQSGLDHLSSAALLLKSHPFLYDSAGYLAHMAIELMLKSWLLHQTSEFEAIHPLPKLIEQVKEIDPEFSLSDREQQTLEYLSNFVELRYPCKNKPIEIGAEDIEQIYELADSVWQQLPESLVQAYNDIPDGKKGNRVLIKRPSDIPRNLELETGITEQ